MHLNAKVHQSSTSSCNCQSIPLTRFQKKNNELSLHQVKLET